MKQCTKCEEIKDFKEFSKTVRTKDGYAGWCKKCEKKYREENKEKILNRQRKYYKDNEEKLFNQKKKWYQDNKKRMATTQKNYREQNCEKRAKQIKKWKQDNKEKIARREFERYHSDILYKIACNLRTRLNKVLCGENKSKSTLALLGCSVKFLKKHLESQFTEGMKWDNHGVHGWHIDHIRPCAKFDLTKPEEQRKCFNYTNLQPLWAEENLKKSDKY